MYYTKRSQRLADYRQQILSNLGRNSLDIQDPAYRISLADLIPGIAFREIWPYAPLFWTPLASYQRDPVVGENHIPRKTDHRTARWLRRSLAGYYDTNQEHPNDIFIVYVGDGSSDLALARNLCRMSISPEARSDQREGFRVGVKMFLFDSAGKIPSEEVPESDYALETFSSWAVLEKACLETLKNLGTVSDNFLILDIDRTVLLPRVLSDRFFVTVGESAFLEYVGGFLLGGKDSLRFEIQNAFQVAKRFPPYIDENSSFWNDEDTRAVAGLLHVSRLMDCEALDLTDLKAWIVEVLKRFPGKLDQKVWNAGLLQRHLEDIQTSLEYLDCSFAHLFRKAEERAMFVLDERDQCRLNGHMVRLVKYAVSNGISPVAYSDRPGASVGLDLRSFFRSRPSSLNKALIEKALPLIFES
ncbi:MAG: hypothetical protein HQL56_08445 [Magnetococcales bacterium]|nr:hypothetical protein [Magnetococcales bacterium]